MKKTLKLFGVLLLGSVALDFMACSSGDEPGGGKASSTAGILDKESGLRLKKAGDYTIYYDDNGRIERVTEGRYATYLFGYNPNTFSYVDSWYGDEEPNEIYKVGYNGSGFLSSMNYSFEDVNEDGYKESESGEASISYSNGHVTKITMSGKGSFYEDDYRYSWTGTGSVTFTWSKNRLVKVTWKETEKGAGETWNYTEEWVYGYEDADENIYLQYTPSLAYAMEDNLDIFAYVGLLGEGPDVLPSSATYYEEETSSDGDDYTNEKTYSFRYGFNKNGSVSYTYVNNSRYDFSYDYAETRSMAWGDSQTKVAGGKQLLKLFKHSHRSRK